MKRLLLLRHAKSDWHSGAASDFERPLNARGEKAAPLIGRRLADRGPRPDRIISSPAKRAEQTGQKVASQIDYPKEEIVYQEEIYEASLTTLIALVRRLDDPLRQVLLVGHNPGLSELGQWLSADAPEWLPTCGLLDLELPVDSWQQLQAGCAALTYYDYPKKTR